MGCKIALLKIALDLLLGLTLVLKITKPQKSVRFWDKCIWNLECWDGVAKLVEMGDNNCQAPRSTYNYNLT